MTDRPDDPLPPTPFPAAPVSLPADDAIRFNRDRKFDLQLSQSLIQERKLAEIFRHAIIESSAPWIKVELKTETWQWRRTGNVAIEYRCKGQPSGISVTKADWWVHQLCDDDGSTMGYILLPVPRLKELCRQAIRDGRYRLGGGDGGEFDVVVLPVSELLRLA